MILIAERLNSSVKATLTALLNNDIEYLTETAKKQAEAGADYIDINAALLGERELWGLTLLFDVVLKNTRCGVMIDSPNPYSVMALIEKVEGRPFIINSVALDSRLEVLKEVIKQSGCGVVALPMCEHIPGSAGERVDNAKRVVDKLDIEHSRIYIDALAVSAAGKHSEIKATLDTIYAIRKELPEVHIVCGVSNVSFGLPKRSIINGAFLTTAMYNGLDAAILDVTDKEIKKAVALGGLISGKDEYCMEYISYIRG